MDRACLQRNLPGSHEYLRGGQDCVSISAATVVVPRVLCLGGPCAGLHRSRLPQSAPVGVLSSALIVSKALHLSPNILAALP